MREETGDAKSASNNNNRPINEKTDATSTTSATATDEEFVGPEFEEDAYYSSLAPTPSFDDLDDISDSEEILVHWHQEAGEIEEIEEADFREERVGDQKGTRREFRLLKAKIREKSRRLLGLVKGAIGLAGGIDGALIAFFVLTGLTERGYICGMMRVLYACSIYRVVKSRGYCAKNGLCF